MEKLHIYANKIHWNIKEFGIKGAILKIFSRLFKEIFKRSEHVFYYKLSSFPDNNPMIPSNMELQTFANIQDIPENPMNSLKNFVRKKGMKEDYVNYYVGKILDCFKDGAVMHALLVDNEIATYYWSIAAEGNYDRYFPYFPLLPEDVVNFGSFTLPRYRGRGFVAILSSHVAEHHRKNGKTRMYATCKIWNTSSRQSILKSGFEEVAMAQRIGAFGKNIVIWTKTGRR